MLDMLKKTKEVLIQCGHCHNMLQDDSGKVCLMGAFNIADHGHYDFEDGHYNKTRAFVTALGFIDLYHAVTWNNRSTETQVLARLDEGISKIIA